MILYNPLTNPRNAMQALASTRAGRIVLHLLALIIDHSLSFHLAGIRRELTRS